MAKLAIEPNANENLRKRPDRFTSHALVEIRKFRLFRIFCHSGVLLDLSLAGFKLEFTGEVAVKAGDQFWLNIPLSPLGIVGPNSINCKIEIRWYDPKRQRIGGVFMHLSRLEQTILGEVIASLSEKSTPI